MLSIIWGCVCESQRILQQSLPSPPKPPPLTFVDTDDGGGEGGENRAELMAASPGKTGSGMGSLCKKRVTIEGEPPPATRCNETAGHAARSYLHGDATY